MNVFVSKSREPKGTSDVSASGNVLEFSRVASPPDGRADSCNIASVRCTKSTRRRNIPGRRDGNVDRCRDIESDFRRRERRNWARGSGSERPACWREVNETSTVRKGLGRLTKCIE